MHSANATDQLRKQTIANKANHYLRDETSQESQFWTDRDYAKVQASIGTSVSYGKDVNWKEHMEGTGPLWPLATIHNQHDEIVEAHVRQSRVYVGQEMVNEQLDLTTNKYWLRGEEYGAR